MKSNGNGLYNGRVRENSLLMVTVLEKRLEIPPERPVVVTVMGYGAAIIPTYSMTNLIF